MYTLYILNSNGPDRYYVGYTNDLERRLSEQNRKKGKYTDNWIPWELI
jgi:putative endonuclease